MIKRLYYLVFHRKRCFRNTLLERCSKWGDFVEWGDKYLGRDWFYRPPNPYKKLISILKGQKK